MKLKLKPIQNYNRKGNISILVIFILLASGLIAVLTMHFVRQILHYNGTVLSYYKSYYMSRAGLELSLTQSNFRGFGFEYQVGSGDSIIKENFDCFNCDFTTRITGKSSFLNKEYSSGVDCNAENALTIKAGESMVLPLFYDSYPFVNQSNVFNEENNYQNTLKYGLRLDLDFVNNPDEISLSLVSPGFTTIVRNYLNPDWDTINYFLREEEFPDDPSVNIAYRLTSTQQNYIIIANLDSEDLKFCLHSHTSNDLEKPIPLETAYIESVGTYLNNSLGLQASYQHNILPSFLGHTTIDF